MKQKAKIFLRALEDTDLDRTHRWHNDSALYTTIVSPFRYVSKQAEAEWLRRKAGYTNNEVNLAICTQTDGEHIGNIYLGEIDWISRAARLGIFIGNSAHRNKGYGKEALQQLLAHAFLDLNLQRVSAEVLADNISVIKLCEKCGFKIEGRIKDRVFKNGIYKDMLLMGITLETFKQGF